MWHRMDDNEVIQNLIQVTGIDRWTAEMFLILHLHRPDACPLIDVGIPKAIAKNYSGGVHPSRHEMSELAEFCCPWRSVSCWYLWRSPNVVPVKT